MAVKARMLVSANHLHIQALLNHNAKVYIASRNKSKAEAAIEELKTETGREAIFLQLDLADLAAIRRAAEEFLRCVLSFTASVFMFKVSYLARRARCMFSSTTRKLHVCIPQT